MTIAGEPRVRHEPERSRFVAELDGHVGVLDYRLADGILAILHTGVPRAIGGRGVAAGLTGAALDWARAHGRKVRPQCAYAEAYFARHPQDRDLLA